MTKRKNRRVMVISDTQMPFEHPDYLRFLIAVKKEYKPTDIVHIGDLFDFHALSDYPNDPDADGAGPEFEKAIVQKKKLQAVFPKMEILTSNHDVRFFKRLAKAGIPRRFWPTYEELFECPDGWSFHDRVEIDEVFYVHGHQIGAGGGNVMQNAIRKYMRSVVFGHFHTRFGIDYHANEDDLLFGMCVGSLIYLKTYAFMYQTSNVRKPVIGTGLVINGLPKLQPMFLNSKGRWTGKL
jgi:predicted phosphodiesterase